MISQFFILAPRGDTIVAKDYRGDVVRGTADIFFRKLKTWAKDAPPIFVCAFFSCRARATVVV